jgi:hypothetical protein
MNNLRAASDKIARTSIRGNTQADDARGGAQAMDEAALQYANNRDAYMESQPAAASVNNTSGGRINGGVNPGFHEARLSAPATLRADSGMGPKISAYPNGPAPTISQIYGATPPPAPLPTPTTLRPATTYEGDGVDGIAKWQGQLADARAANIRASAPVNNASGGQIGGGVNPGSHEARMPEPAAPVSTSPGLFDATKANLASSTEGMNNARGFGQTVGATIGGAAKIAGGLVLDAGRNLVMNPLSAAAGFAGDALTGAGVSLPQTIRSASAAPVPSQAAVTSQPSAPVAPPTAFEARNAMNGGVPVTDQRGAWDVSANGVRGANAAIQQFPEQGKNATFNLGTNGGNTTIYGQATKGSNKVNSFTGTGADDGGKGDALQREMSAQKIADMERTAAIGRDVQGLRVANNDAGTMGFGSGTHPKSIERMNAETAQEANQINERNSIRTNDTARWTGERQLSQNLRQMQWDRSKFGVEQGNKDREYKQGVANDDIRNKDSREKQIQSNLEAMNTTIGGDGKPVVDQSTVRIQRAGIDRAVARLGAKGVHELSPMDEQRLLTGSRLMARLQADGSNFNPFKPDFLKTVDPLDLVNMRRLPNGDGQLTSKSGGGQVIRARYLNKQGAERFMPGTPTNEYDILFQGDK